ncbi:MAG: hypothetical protein A2X23_10900 [Chloroflexi bacterium GWC2_73_18]|nr:MAG: hypothetical protein A2X23_10900 [Chloroflexi bacterium GWC2_73_18]
MPPVPDPYRLLGLDRSADEREIKRTYRRLAKRYHPDTTSGADVRHFLALQHAYELLGDPLRRREWDRRHPTSGYRRAAAAMPTSRRAGATPAAQDRDRPRDVRGRFARPDPSVPWWEEVRTPGTARPETSGSRGEPGLGPSASGAAWSSASRAYFRRLTRPEASSGTRRPAPRRPAADAG